jgi:hypothetical protein
MEFVDIEFPTRWRRPLRARRARGRDPHQRPDPADRPGPRREPVDEVPEAPDTLQELTEWPGSSPSVRLRANDPNYRLRQPPDGSWEIDCRSTTCRPGTSPHSRSPGRIAVGAPRLHGHPNDRWAARRRYGRRTRLNRALLYTS